jgi:uncharacterized protein YggT (Ycf19 family)
MNDDNQAATKRDLGELERDLKAFILEREIKTLRWSVGVLMLYFFGTLASVWFLVNQQTNQISQLLQHWKS